MKGGLRERRVVVRRGMEDRKPRRIALERVEMAGEPKQRWWYRAKAASEMLRIEGVVTEVGMVNGSRAAGGGGGKKKGGENFWGLLFRW